MRGPWSVILEVPGKQPMVVYQTPQHSNAVAMVNQVGVAYRDRKGTRVYCRTAESTDQLQVSARGAVVRDQPHLAPVGEDKVIVVPTGRLSVQ